MSTFDTLGMSYVQAADQFSYLPSSAIAMESADRTTLELAYGGADLVKYVADRFNDTIVVVNSPGAVNLTSFYDHPNVTSILMAYYPGQEGGNSLVDVLFGDVNPSGHLPFTIGKYVEDYDQNAYYNETRAPFPKSNFSEGIYIDYKVSSRLSVLLLTISRAETKPSPNSTSTSKTLLLSMNMDTVSATRREFTFNHMILPCALTFPLRFLVPVVYY